MKIASLGPNGVVEAQSETQKKQYDVVDYPEAVVAASKETPAETGNSNQEKAKFSRIFDLLQVAKKQGKLKHSSKDKKRTRGLKNYLRQKDFQRLTETLGTLFKSSA